MQADERTRIEYKRALAQGCATPALLEDANLHRGWAMRIGRLADALIAEDRQHAQRAAPARTS